MQPILAASALWGIQLFFDALYWLIFLASTTWCSK